MLLRIKVKRFEKYLKDIFKFSLKLFKKEQVKTKNVHINMYKIVNKKNYEVYMNNLNDFFNEIR